MPEKVLTNHDIAKIVDTSDEWIVQRTGIKERRVCGDGESTSTLACGRDITLRAQTVCGAVGR